MDFSDISTWEALSLFGFLAIAAVLGYFVQIFSKQRQLRKYAKGRNPDVAVPGMRLPSSKANRSKGK